MKKIKQGILLTLLTCLMLVVVPTSANAASTNLVKLKTNKTYTSYDVTRDGKKDKLKVVQSASYATSGETKMKVYVNGKKKFTATGCKGCPIYVFRNGSKSVILSQPYAGDGASCFYAYYYSGGKFKKNEIGPGYFYSEAKKSGSNLKIYSQPKGPWWLNSFSNFTNMPFKAVDTYKISKGKLVKNNSYSEISGTKTYYAKKAFKTGKTISSISSKNGPSVKAGQKVTLKNIHYKNGYYYYRISVNGKSGWFKDSKAIQFTKK